VWLFPLSVASVVLPSFKWLLVFIAISPLLAFCIYIKAGKPDK